jgi:glutaconate CoA-transferase subunit B
MNRDQVDHVVAVLARTVPDHSFVGVGLGTPSALVAAVLATRLRGGHVLAGGAFDVTLPIDGWMAGPDGTLGKTGGYVPHFVSMDWAERQTMTLQFLRPAQIDGRGNLNTSRLGGVDRPGRRFPGGLATGDVPSLLPQIITYLPRHRPRSTPEKVDFVTGAGGATTNGRFASRGVTTLVTDMGVVEWDAGEPHLTQVHPWTTIDEIVAATGFPMNLESSAVSSGPSENELRTLETIDPNRLRDRELTSA